MFLPIGDENPREKTPVVNYALLAANILTFLALCFPEPSPRVIATLALVPARLELSDLITSMFLHANLAHLAGNMLFLWIFGDNVEDKLGHVLYLLFYVAAGLAASFLHIATLADSTVPMLGASGAISGVVGAYVLFFPRHNIRMLLWFGFFIDILLVQAFWWAGIWFLTQLAFGLLGFAGVAYWAHIGGFVAGVGVAAIWKYLLFPAQFGLHGPDEPYPTDLLASSRTRGTRPTVGRPLVTIDLPPSEFAREEHTRFAILRMEDDVSHAGRIAELAADAAGIAESTTLRRLRTSRGVVARDLDRSSAERVHEALHRAGIPTLLLPDDRSSRPPAPSTPEGLAWDAFQLRFRHRNDLLSIPWPTPFLYLGASVGHRPFIDIFVTAHERQRITDEIPLRFVDADSRTERPASLRAFATHLIRLRRGALINEGVRVLASHGTWGWLAFQNEEGYEDYAFWAYNLILSSRPYPRF
ncbi:MAG: rhomboid family intramembrane serine protease [Planctomycetes bacterium]|nr:rhomboid family intramembrane serine protease [Planctomycetota bacterium]